MHVISTYMLTCNDLHSITDNQHNSQSINPVTTYQLADNQPTNQPTNPQQTHRPYQQTNNQPINQLATDHSLTRQSTMNNQLTNQSTKHQPTNETMHSQLKNNTSINQPCIKQQIDKKKHTCNNHNYWQSTTNQSINQHANIYQWPKQQLPKPTN